jgi:hypothetical protein
MTFTFKHRAAAGQIFWTYLGRGPAAGQKPGMTWPHPYVPTSLLENWTALTRTGFLVLRLRVIRYERRNKRAAATTKKLRPGRGRPRHKKRAAAGRGSAAGCGPRAPMSCIGVHARPLPVGP